MQAVKSGESSKQSSVRSAISTLCRLVLLPALIPSAGSQPQEHWDPRERKGLLGFPKRNILGKVADWPDLGIRQALEGYDWSSSEEIQALQPITGSGEVESLETLY